MKNIFTYLEYFGDVSFKEMAFNDVDSLILTQLVYSKFKGIAPSDFNSVKLEYICEGFLKKYSPKDFKKEDYLFPNSYHLNELLVKSKRFKDGYVSYYIEEATKKNQFGALTIRFNNGICYVAFEGTDSSIVGWLEDLELIYKYPIVSQQRGCDYLNKVIKVWDRNIYIGGHSKGGNIAMYAYMNAKSSIKKRIKNVYNFDGPGFLDDVINSNVYKELEPKLKMYVPEQSVFGMILGHHNYQVVKSHGLGVLQHDGYTWCCFGGKLEKGVLSKKSRKLENSLVEYLDNMTIDEKKEFIRNVAIACEHLGIVNVMQIREIKLTSVINFFKELRTVPSSTKKRCIDVIKMLLMGAS